MTETEAHAARRGERGAALVTALMLSTLLLVAGGALILTTSTGTVTAADSTAEMQAYYAAESGLQSALAVLRRNVPSTPAGTPATFRNVVCAGSDPCNNSGDLSLWLPRVGGVVPISDTQLSFTVTVRDPTQGAQLPAAPYQPRYLIVTSEGRGLKGARKVMQMKVEHYPFDFTARAAVGIRSSDVDTTPMQELDLGSSNPHAWNGNDQATPPGPSLPAFSVTNTADYDAGDGFGTEDSGNLQGTAEEAVGGDQANVLGSQQLVKLNPASLEEWLQTADNARAFLTTMRARAEAMGRLNPTTDRIGSEASPKFTFIDGDLAIGGGDNGAGLLIVTGTITQGGGSSFKGIILALGDGKFVRNGTPDAMGALIVARFNRGPGATGGFLAPYLDAAGGGNSIVRYNSEWVRRALETGGVRVMGVNEF